MKKVAPHIVTALPIAVSCIISDLNFKTKMYLPFSALELLQLSLIFQHPLEPTLFAGILSLLGKIFISSYPTRVPHVCKLNGDVDFTINYTLHSLPFVECL